MSTIPGLENAPTNNKKLLEWVEEVAELTQPDRIEWSDGSEEEWDRLTAAARRAAAPSSSLNEAKRPNRFLARSNPKRRRPRRGPHLHLLAARGGRRPHEQLARPGRDARRRSKGLFAGSMRGRTMYVVPFSMGPLGSRISQLGVEITDSPYVVVNMRIMTRMGQAALDLIGEDGDFVPALHSVGAPARRGRGRRRVAVQRRPSTSSTSPRPARSGRTARATAATRCSARSASRCASPRSMARDEGWLAEHMLILKLTLAERRRELHRGGVPVGVRQDQPRDARADAPGLEGRDRRRRHLLDALRRGRPAATRSTPRPASSASRPAPRSRPTPTRSSTL